MSALGDPTEEVTPTSPGRALTEGESLATLRRDLEQLQRKVGELQRRIEQVVAAHNDLDNVVDGYGEELNSLATWREFTANAVRDLQGGFLALTGAVNTLIGKLTKERLLDSKKDRMQTAVNMALIAKFELPIDLGAFDDEASDG